MHKKMHTQMITYFIYVNLRNGQIQFILIEGRRVTLMGIKESQAQNH